jgi:hypothetical protein
MPAAAARQACLEIGIDMVVHAFSGHPLQRVIGMLGPLGPELAGQVVDRLGKKFPAPPPAPAAVTQRWRDAYGRLARNVSGDRIASALGRSLLAALYRRLGDPLRAAARDLCRSNFADALESDQFLEPVAAEELAIGQTVASAALSRGAGA